MAHNTSPWDRVVRKWKRTSEHRHNELVQNPGTICDYMNQYPVLTRENGHALIEIDFENLYNVKDIYVEWSSFYDWCYSTASTDNLRKATELTTLLSKKDISDRE